MKKSSRIKTLFYLTVIALIFGLSAFSISQIPRVDKYQKMVAKAQDVPLWQADTKPLISESEFRHNFELANQQGVSRTRVAANQISGVIVPGLRGAWSVDHQSKQVSFGNNWVPQGVTQNQQSYFISLYDGDHQRNSVIMVVDKASKQYQKTLILGSRSHVGGLAYDAVHQRLWWSNDGSKFAGLSYASMDEVNAYQASQGDHILPSERIRIPWASRTSGIAYHQNEFYVVKYGQDAASRTIAVMDVDPQTGLPNPNQDIKIVYQGGSFRDYINQLIAEKKIKALASGFDRMQGLAIAPNQMALITQSNGDHNSVLMVAWPNGKKGAQFDYDATIPAKQRVILPPSVEQVSIDSSDNYNTIALLFESGAKMYREQGQVGQRARIIDRVVIMPTPYLK